MQVDSNLPEFTDPASGQVQTDPYSGDVYVSWSGVDVKPSLVNAGTFNPNRIKLIVSSDGGNNFTSEAIADVNSSQPDNGNGPTTERDSAPALTVSQGRPASESGLNGDAGVPGGQVAVTWDNFGDGAAHGQHGLGGPGLCLWQAPPGRSPSGRSRISTMTVQFPAGFDFSTLSNLTVTIAAVNAADANLGLTLIAPSGDRLTLVLDQTPTVGGTANTGIGISGSNLGVISYTNNNIATYAIGTTFDDNATRDIFDPNTGGTNANTAPYIGNYRIEGAFGPGGGGSLDAFLRTEIAKGINGTWQLETNDTQSSAPSSPQFINFWTLNFTQGLNPDVNDVVMPGTKGLVVPGAVASTYSTASAASPVGIGPGVVMAQDNTLGSFSPYEGRIYAAFVGYYNVTVFGVKNPADNTDIFLTYSDDGGRTWSTPVQVNDDQANRRRLSPSRTTTPPRRTRSPAGPSSSPRSRSIR